MHALDVGRPHGKAPALGARRRCTVGVRAELLPAALPARRRANMEQVVAVVGRGCCREIPCLAPPVGCTTPCARAQDTDIVQRPPSDVHKIAVSAPGSAACGVTRGLSGRRVLATQGSRGLETGSDCAAGLPKRLKTTPKCVVLSDLPNKAPGCPYFSWLPRPKKAQFPYLPKRPNDQITHFPSFSSPPTARREEPGGRRPSRSVRLHRDHVPLRLPV